MRISAPLFYGAWESISAENILCSYVVCGIPEWKPCLLLPRDLGGEGSITQLGSSFFKVLSISVH